MRDLIRVRHGGAATGLTRSDVLAMTPVQLRDYQKWWARSLEQEAAAHRKAHRAAQAGAKRGGG